MPNGASGLSAPTFPPELLSAPLLLGTPAPDLSALELSMSTPPSPAAAAAVLERMPPPPSAPPATLERRDRRTPNLSLGTAHPFGWTLGPLLAMSLWAVGSGCGLIDGRVLPAPWIVARTAFALMAHGPLRADIAVSVQRAAEGLIAGTVLGVAAALAAGLTLTGGYLLDSLVQMKRAVPTLALIPLFLLWFGISDAMKISVIALSVFLQIYVHTHHALRAIDARHVELAESLGLSRSAFVRHVVLPGALPGFLLGLRFGTTSAWLALVVVEQVNATSGIGYLINIAQNYAQTDVILVGIVIYALLGLASDAAVRLIERTTLSWRRTLAP